VNLISPRWTKTFAALALGLTARLCGAADETPPLFPEPMNAASIQLGLQKLNVLGRVLYVAAHPDDENTTLIALWANGSLYDMAYLSVTRGDGGQNLIGSELREKLGLIRTEELLAARRTDHGQQFFTRAIDFGFSKHADETLRIWDRGKILADIVWVIRKFRPDVIVTRFSPDDDKTHGHHTASAILAREAFKAAGDPKRFPEQLRFVKIWKPTRLVWNTSPFFYANRNQKFDPTGLTTVDISGFNPLLGKSYSEIAAASLSMHKSQGVGSPPRRGLNKSYFQLLEGPPMKDSPLDGVDTTWARVHGATDVADKIQDTISTFTPSNPAASVPKLFEIRKALSALKDDSWVATKQAEVDRLIAACLGLYIEASTEQSTVTPGAMLPIKFEAINRSKAPVRIVEVRAPISGNSEQLGVALSPNELFTEDLWPTVPATVPYSQPYWLRKPPEIGTFVVDDQKLIGLPENPPAFPIEVALEVGDGNLRFTLDTKYRSVDPVAGELHDDLVVAPPVFANLPNPVFVFGDDKSKTIPVRVRAATGAVHGEVRLQAPSDWRIEPATVPVELKAAGAEAIATFTVTPPAKPNEGKLRAIVFVGGHDYSFAREQIAYPHIGTHILMPPAEAKIVRADIRTSGHSIGYVPGAGDDIPQSLEQIGYAVKILEPPEVKAANLARYDAVVLGIRAYNTQDRIEDLQKELLEYVKAGGTVVVQYNTTADLKTKNIGPYPLAFARDRVTDETAEVKILASDHPVMNTPNKISAADFNNWVQERGLYFPNKWEAAYTAILSCHDPGEPALDGGLLVAKSGKGYFIYTGYSWFRQLPAGVTGAYRIFANMVSLHDAK
jgi:LmbE family N-acetylglucosaminyl deacetylase